MPTVRNIKAILGIEEWEGYTWANPASRGASVIVTYSFSGGSNLDRFGGDDFPGASFHKFTSAQQRNFKTALEEFEDTTGIRFVETSGRAMINVARGQNTDTGGFANYPYTTEDESDGFFSELVIDGFGNFGKGSYEYQAMLHEIGHAVGLAHPHEGYYTLASGMDNINQTIMTYNVDNLRSYARELGDLDIEALRYLYGGRKDAQDLKIKLSGDVMKITGTGRADEIIGASEKNVINGGIGKDKLYGREYADILRGERGDDKLFGLVGKDTLYGGRGDDKLDGYRGNDKLYGGKGDDRIEASLGANKMYGNDGADTIDGGLNNDKIYGGNGKDRAEGSWGSDVIYGGVSADRLYGNQNGDDIYGGRGDDTIVGGSGNDLIFGGGGHDTMTGGSDRDRFVFTAGRDLGDDTITDFQRGQDVIDISAFNTDYDALRILERDAGAKIVFETGTTITLTDYLATNVTSDFFDF